MKFSNISSILALATFSLLVAPMVKGAPIALCSEQEKCFSFTTQVVGSSSCWPSEPCVIQVCMQYTNQAGCPKGGDPISHMCDSGDANGCLRTTSNLFDGDGSDVCSADESGGTEKCKDAPENVIYCQEALPGDTVYFIAKDGRIQNGPDQYDNGGDGIISPVISCDSAANVGAGNCGNVLNQAPQEMVWSYQIPSDLFSLGCAPPPPPPFCPPGTSLTMIDFSQNKDGTQIYQHGDYITNPGYGFSLSIQPGSGGKAVSMPRIYNSAISGGADSDLEVGMGNLLIIQEDNGANDDPDDNENGGKFFFNFDAPTKIKSIGLVDTEEQVLMSFFKSSGSVERVRPAALADGESAVVTVDQDDVEKIKIAARGSVGIPFIELCV